MGVIVGIDLDARALAYSVWNRGRVRVVSTIVRSDARGRMRGDWVERLGAFVKRCAETGAVVYVEDIFLQDRKQPGKGARYWHGNVVGFKSLAKVHGELEHEARRYGVVIVSVKPSVWHSRVLGFTRGRPELKAAAKEKAAELLGAGERSEHEDDAVCIGWFGVMEVEGGKALARRR